MFTSTRADAGPLGPVVEALDRSPDAHLVVIATGTHLDERRGRTIDTLAVSEPSVVEAVDAALGGDDPRSLSTSLGAVAGGVSRVLEEREVEIMVVLGDRWELLGAAGAAVIHQVPVAHLHGGEVTEGALDERVRHAVTKLADLHLCAAEPFRDRIVQMGEEPGRVHVTGAPALDRFAGVDPLDLDALGERLGLELRAPFGVVTYHPPTVDRAEVASRARAVFEAAGDHLASAVITYPGHDPGGNAVIDEIEEACAARDRFHAVPNLGDAYATVLASADVMVGNSSSGVIEAASFRLPVVNVGDRQAGRIHPANVVAAGETRPEIAAAIERALDPAFRAGLDGLANPYGDGHAAERIARIVLETPLDELRRKRFVDLEWARER